MQIAQEESFEESRVAEKSHATQSNVLFLSKVIKQVGAGQLQDFLGQAGCLNPFQSGLGFGYMAKVALDTLVDDLHHEMDMAT